jgi:hypothetical protein
MKPHLTLLAGLLIPLASVAAPATRPTVGAVHQVEGNQLQVCFRYDAPPAIGTTLAIQTGYVPYKSSGATVYRTIGHARVTAVESSCATAELADGHAKRHDRVVAVDVVATAQGDCHCPC